MIKTCEPEFKTLLFQQLGVLVSKVKQHIRDYLNEIFQLIRDYWNQTSNSGSVVYLIEEISVALGDEFRPHITELLPLLLQILHNDNDPNRDPTVKVLHAFSVFGTNLDDFLHLVIPNVIKLGE